MAEKKVTDTIKEDRTETKTSTDYELENKPSWKNRRRVIFGSLLFCALVWVYVLGSPLIGVTLIEKIAEVALTMSAFLAGSVIGSYVFGAVWSDVGMKKK